MATKDWKYFGITSGGIVWGRKDSYNKMSNTPGYRLEIKEWRNIFIVRKNIRGDFGWNKYKLKGFKTKQQALAFAKAYMRKH